ncbi:hypothetical protein CAPN004_11610 [Capnocytophaga cynodegmi]|nr:hypothetical protein CAPN004_11610 [Capnocytophaga cynodegmi]
MKKIKIFIYVSIIAIALLILFTHTQYQPIKILLYVMLGVSLGIEITSLIRKKVTN